mgnify:CR=1 FL=1
MKSIEIELSTRCVIKCPACPRTKSPGQIQERPINNWNVGFLDKELVFKLFHEYYGIYNFCGAYGDPIYHPDIIEIIQKLIKHKKVFNIETNGSKKSSEFWYEIADNDWDKPNQGFTFSIDGLEDTNHIYRKNSDWKRIKCSIFISVNKTTWINITISSHKSHVIIFTFWNYFFHSIFHLSSSDSKYKGL